MILVPDPHKTRHKKMTGELIPSPSCNGVSSPYQGLLLRPKCASELKLNLRSEEKCPGCEDIIKLFLTLDTAPESG